MSVTNPEPPDAALAAILRWVDWHGSIVDYECPAAAVPGLFFAMHRQGLVERRNVEVGTRRHGKSRLVLTEAGRAFVAAHRRL